MAIDPYDLCPCYSGKKVKFCCQPVVEEMEKAAMQIGQKNYRSAIKLCQQAEKKSPGLAWPLILHAFALQQENSITEAYELMKNVVMNMQDHPGVFSMFTSIHLKKMGYAESRKLVDRAIQIALKHPDPMQVLPLIYNPLSMVIDEDKHLLSARYFLTVDISSCNPEIQQHLMHELYDMDNYADYPLNIRGPQFLKLWKGPDEETQQLFDKFMQTSGYGMLERALAQLQKLLDKFPDDAELWWNKGLILAWDQREQEACDALKKSAALFSDNMSSIEAYALMIAITWHVQFSEGERFTRVYKVNGLSKLLTELDQSNRFRKTQDDLGDENVEISMYWGIDRESKEEELQQKTNWRDFPSYLGQVHIISSKNKEGIDETHCWLLAEDDSRLEELDKQLKSAAQNELSQAEITQDEIKNLPLNNKRYVPDLKEVWGQRVLGLGKKGADDTELIYQEMEDRITQNWMNQPLQVLDGNSISNAASQPALKNLCQAVLFVVEVMLRVKPSIMDKVYQQLKFERLPLLKLDQLTDPAHVSNFQLYHLDFTGLDHDTLYLINERVHILQDITTTIRVLEEIYKLDEVKEDEKLAITIELAKNYFRHFRTDKANEWILKSEAMLNQMDIDSETKLKYDFTILSYYFSTLDKDMQSRIKTFRQKYEIKFPEIKETLRNISIKAAEKMGEPIPADTPVSGGLWTPDQEVPAAASSGGLWIPGN